MTQEISCRISRFIFMMFLSFQALLMGGSAILLKDKVAEGVILSFLGYICVLAGVMVPIVYFYRLIVDKNFRESQGKPADVTKSVQDFSFSSFFAEDIRLLSFIRKMPSIIWPFILFLMATVSFLIVEIKYLFVFKLFLSGPIWMIVVYFYFLVFMVISFFMLSYMAVGEILQRKFSKAKHHFAIDMLLDYIVAIPFIALFSFVFILFLFRKREKRENLVLYYTKTIGWFAGIIALKYFIYLNLAMIAFEDRFKWVNVKEALQLLKQEAGAFYKIFINSGLILATIAFNALMLTIWNEHFQIVSQQKLMLSAGVLLLAAFLFGLFIEQIAFLMHFIKMRHPQCLDDQDVK